MDTSKRSILFLLALALAGALVFCLFPRDLYADRNAALRVGAGDDVTGVLMGEITARARADGSGALLGLEEGRAGSGVEGAQALSGPDSQDAVEGYTFMDCCANSSQWALLSQDIELGFYCSHIALHLVNQNNDFEIYGPALMNGEVVASLAEPDQIHTLGYPQKRQHLAELAASACPNAEELVQMNPSALLYALENGQVDGAVVDVSQAAKAPQFCYTPLSENDYISYCLVVRKDVKETAAFTQFLAYYNQAVEALNAPGTLETLLGMDEAFWTDAGTLFLAMP